MKAAAGEAQHYLRGQRLELLGRLSGGLVHELNNLLGAIGHNAQLAERSSADPQTTLLMASILASVESGGRLTRRLLRLAEPRPPRPRAIDLAAELPMQRELLELALGSRIALRIEVDEQAGSVEVDAGELELALLNLALNAREAMSGAIPAAIAGGAPRCRPGQVRLEARAATAEESIGLPHGHYAAICLSDDGRGLDEALAEQVFAPFFGSKPAGSGRGLSQVRAFCEHAGGRCWLRSAPGRGTAVWLLLPARPAHALATPQDAGAADASLLAGLRLLIVDADADFAAATAALLARYGCRAQCVADAAGALEIFGPGCAPIDVLLCEALLPDLPDGIALARLLRGRCPGLRVIMTSSRTDASRCGVALLHKPIAPQRLLAMLRAAREGAVQAGTLPPWARSTRHQDDGHGACADRR
ncbi:ATP-binding protein [Roseateles violae]|uniref:histidine kinase n=1 Tax=Roseateles violae TaxID=3058042 RepID=A0ABT8DVN7_9BURK|nr:ATP-binding protein [Pelomonas sp. PFR6]MDN3922330.1 ATP-binding protein [Pelomonas sp. PFR6]